MSNKTRYIFGVADQPSTNLPSTFQNPQPQVIFISHQWLGTKFPDPSGHQVAQLRVALRRLMDKSLKVEADLTRMDLGEAISYEQVP